MKKFHFLGCFIIASIVAYGLSAHATTPLSPLKPSLAPFYHPCCQGLVMCYDEVAHAWGGGTYDAGETVECNKKCPSDAVANKCLRDCGNNAGCKTFYD